MKLTSRELLLLRRDLDGAVRALLRDEDASTMFSHLSTATRQLEWACTNLQKAASERALAEVTQ